MKKILVLFITLLILAVTFVACDSKEKVGADGEVLFELKTSGQDVVQTGLPPMVGEKLNVWEKYGLYVTRTHYSGGPPQLEAAPAGDWFMGWIGVTAANNGLLKYDMIALCLSGYDNSNIAIGRTDGDIFKSGLQNYEGAKTTYGTREDWKGKDILCPIGTVDYMDLTTMLSRIGLTDEDVNIINIDTTSMRQAFLAGEGDVMFVSSYLAAEFADKEGFEIVHTMDGMDATMSGVLLTTREFLEENEDIVVKYLEGSLEILLWLAKEENKEEAAKLFVDGMNEEFGVQLSLEGSILSMDWIEFYDLSFYENLCKVGDDGLTGLQREYKIFYENHVKIGLQEQKDLDAILASCDTTYLEKAIANYKKNNGIN